MLTRDEIEMLYRAGPGPMAALVESLLQTNATLQAEVTSLKARVTELEARLKQDSHNSHKPPSSDGLGKKGKRAKSLRRRSGKKSGGQPGHPGTTLEFVAQPTHVVPHSACTCQHCGTSLQDAAVVYVERRQVTDLPEVRPEVTEHRVLHKACARCGQPSAGHFPPGVTQPVQYGPRVRAWGTYLTTYQLLPLARAQALLVDLVHLELSDGTLCAWQTLGAQLLKPVEHAIHQALCQAPVVHFDETGLRVEQTLLWLHSASTARLTFYAVHAKRGHKAIDAIGILPVFCGRAVHDGLRSYWRYACAHSVCNAHLLRELIALHEETGQPWADALGAWLGRSQALVTTARAEGLRRLALPDLQHLERGYDALVAEGLRDNPATPPSGQRGRTAQSAAYNLVCRLRDHRPEILAFLYDFDVPFDNNQAERDLRMMKLRQKISGCFRSRAAAQAFCTIRGYLSTMRKQGQSVLLALTSVFAGAPLLPDLSA